MAARCGQESNVGRRKHRGTRGDTGRKVKGVEGAQPLPLGKITG